MGQATGVSTDGEKSNEQLKAYWQRVTTCYLLWLLGHTCVQKERAQEVVRAMYLMLAHEPQPAQLDREQRHVLYDMMSYLEDHHPETSDALEVVEVVEVAVLWAHYDGPTMPDAHYFTSLEVAPGPH